MPSNGFRSAGNGAQAGRLRVMMAMVGRNAEGSSREPAYTVKRVLWPRMPPKTSPPHVGQKFRSASPPAADFDVKHREGPLKRIALARKAINGTKPEPEALRQSSQ